jgi:hypothetical protein
VGLVNVDIFNKDAPWAAESRPYWEGMVKKRLSDLAEHSAGARLATVEDLGAAFSILASQVGLLPGLPRAKDELALETARLEPTMCLGDLIEGDPLGDARLDGASCQQAEELLQVLQEPGGMSRPHYLME